MKQDWSWKPPIHKNEPVVEVGLKYSYDKRKKRKVHEINPATGKSFCKVENGTNRRLTQSVDFPEGRAPCATCQSIKSRESGSVITRKVAGDFYTSHEWAELRYKAFLKYGRECVVCGTNKNLTVDHIKPLRKYPDLMRDIDNLQVMCRLCNRGKGRWDETDWR